ncbi:cytochrome P450 [Hysterangium stoloniferum]|nr:cytochrome P450 [Hysterangium stoloniferum]
MPAFPNPTANEATVGIVLSGLIVHLYFNRKEPQSLHLMLCPLFLPPICLGLLFQDAYGSLLKAVVISYSVFTTSLATSVVLYRISPFHPLAQYPGPLLCKITRLWSAYLSWSGKQHVYSMYLRRRYGQHVRTGPNHLIVFEPSAIPTVLGMRKFRKKDRYILSETPSPDVSVFNMFDMPMHSERRKLWDRAMGSKALDGYMEPLAGRVSQLLSLIGKEGKNGGTVDLAACMSYFSFDFMGDLGFNGVFKIMENNGDPDGYMRVLVDGVSFFDVICSIPWSKAFLQFLPSDKTGESLVPFYASTVQNRISQGGSKKDLFYYLLDEEGSGDAKLSMTALIEEAGLLIFAGTDTTATTLSNTFYYLMSHPEIMKRLQKEIDEVFPRGTSIFDNFRAADMKYLKAVINETSRLAPVVPNGNPRFLPRGSGGEMVAGKFVPEWTTVQIPAYCVHRDPRYYPNPEEFRPERWLEEAPGVNLEEAFIPFAAGPTSCAGKNLVLLEMRMAICGLIQKFEFEFDPGYNRAEWLDNMEDHFVLTKGRLPVRVKVRS